MLALVIWIIVALAIALVIFGFVMWIFLCLNSAGISEEEREMEFEIAWKRAKEIWKRRQDKDV